MTNKDFIAKKILITNASISSFKRWSFILITLAVVSIVLSFFQSIKEYFSPEFLKFGLSSITTVSSAALQGVIYLRRHKLVDLEYCLERLDKYELLNDFEKKIIDNAVK